MTPRETLIGDFVRRLTTLTFQAPARMSEEAKVEHVELIAEATAEALPGSLSNSDIAEALEAARKRLGTSQRSRAWPVAADVGDMVRACIPKRAASSGADDGGDKRRAIRAQTARDWWAQFGDLPGWLADDHTIRALLADGVSARAMHRAGLTVPKAALDADPAPPWRAPRSKPEDWRGDIRDAARDLADAAWAGREIDVRRAHYDAVIECAVTAFDADAETLAARGLAVPLWLRSTEALIERHAQQGVSPRRMPMEAA